MFVLNCAVVYCLLGSAATDGAIEGFDRIDMGIHPGITERIKGTAILCDILAVQHRIAEYPAQQWA